jgi:hypothetical protein
MLVELFSGVAHSAANAGAAILALAGNAQNGSVNSSNSRK